MTTSLGKFHRRLSTIDPGSPGTGDPRFAINSPASRKNRPCATGTDSRHSRGQDVTREEVDVIDLLLGYEHLPIRTIVSMVGRDARALQAPFSDSPPRGITGAVQVLFRQRLEIRPYLAILRARIPTCLSAVGSGY
ncbi:hypothetical protein [Nocardia sp. NPDC050710]|uniref:hypothetical protein n=1 Tax=Nocardia sp. NPDC050710 TaxID=3157220 RepID=UPI003406D2D9